jgi:hypothetical protein
MLIVTISESAIMNNNTERKFLYLEGERAYQFPIYRNRDTTKANRYHLKDGEPFWFDSQRTRVVTSDPQLYLQTLQRSDTGTLVRRLILNIAGRKIQLSKSNGESLDVKLPKSDGFEAVWRIEEIGSPLHYFTGHDDVRAGIKRPFDERYQILTNASGFESLEQQTRGLDFITSVLEKYANIFSDGPAGGRDLPAVVKFSDELIKRIEDGDLIDG